MNKEEDILARILEIIMYSLMLWIFVSGSLTNDLSLLQPLFFFLTTYLFVDYSGKLRKAKVNRGGEDSLCAAIVRSKLWILLSIWVFSVDSSSSIEYWEARQGN